MCLSFPCEDLQSPPTHTSPPNQCPGHTAACTAESQPEVGGNGWFQLAFPRHHRLACSICTQHSPGHSHRSTLHMATLWQGAANTGGCGCLHLSQRKSLPELPQAIAAQLTLRSRAGRRAETTPASPSAGRDCYTEPPSTPLLTPAPPVSTWAAAATSPPTAAATQADSVWHVSSERAARQTEHPALL